MSQIFGFCSVSSIHGSVRYTSSMQEENEDKDEEEEQRLKLQPAAIDLVFRNTGRYSIKVVNKLRLTHL